MKANFTEQNIEDLNPGFEKFARLIMEECAMACTTFDCGRTMSPKDLIEIRFELDN